MTGFDFVCNARDVQILICWNVIPACHLERRTKSAVETQAQRRATVRSDLAGTLMRSRFALSLWSGSTTKTSPRDVFFAQDDDLITLTALRIANVLFA